ncbi:hypothetical protein BN3658_02467 [Coriobacteriaceae bacterium CHKCI002]|nr:hypothetical protein BN3658_02467 [Coriobacteriaceae bacterium CHKCI002]
MNKSAFIYSSGRGSCREPLLLQRPLQKGTSSFKLMSCYNNRSGIQVVLVFESIPYGQ